MKLAIVGLGIVGTSLGIALKGANAEISIMGHDPEAENVKRAKKLGAIDKSHWNLISACEGADLIVFDLSLEEVEKTLKAIQEYLAPSTVIIDMAPVKQPVFEVARRFLPEGVQFVGGHVISPRLLATDTRPSAELLKDATFYIIATEDASPAALDIASNFAVAVGAKPQYIDAAEHDGLVAATLELPLLGALALMHTVTEHAGWQDRVKSVGGELATIGTTLLNAPPGIMDLVLSNPDDVSRWLDAYTERLAELRQLVVNQDREKLTRLLEEAVTAYIQGLTHGETKSDVALPDSGSYLRGMFLGKLGEPRKARESPKK